MLTLSRLSSSPWLLPSLRRGLLCFAIVRVGCTAKAEFILMETPASSHAAAVDPFAHLQDVWRDPLVEVFYRTNRQPSFPLAPAGCIPHGPRLQAPRILSSSGLQFYANACRGDIATQALIIVQWESGGRRSGASQAPLAHCRVTRHAWPDPSTV